MAATVDKRELVQPFGGFGESRLLPSAAWQCGELDRPKDNRTMRRLIRENCPAAPGVYGMIDGDGQLIYVGKSKLLPDRLQSYFQAGRDSKTRRIAGHARRIVWEAGPHEFVALCRELELIRRHLPRLNVRGRSDRLRRVYLCIGRGPAPYVYLSDKPPLAGKVFGPLAAGSRLQEAARRLNHLFRLRDCTQQTPLYFADQLELLSQPHEPKCLRFDLGTCLGPCAGACTARQYAAEVKRLTTFLSGGDNELVGRLQEEMLMASRNSQFERAASLRDTWLDLKWLRERLELRERMHALRSFVYPMTDPQGTAWWYLFQGAHVAAIMPAPTDRAAARACRRQLKQLYQKSEKPEAIEDLSFLLLVAGWFRQYPDEWQKALTPAAALEHCQGMLSAGACRHVAN